MKTKKKLYLIALLSVAVLAVISALPGGIYAANIEAILPSNDGSDAFQVKDSGGTSLMDVLSDGKVGIGTTTPKEIFQLGDRWTFSDGGWKVMSLNSFWNGTNDVRIATGPSAAMAYTSDGDILFRTASSGIAGDLLDGGGFSTWVTPPFIIKNGGSVGVGTSSPARRFEVFEPDAGAHQQILSISGVFGGSVNNFRSIVWRDEFDQTVAGIGSVWDGSTNNIHFHSQYNGGVKSESDVTMSIMGTGNVGIGTTSPTVINGTFDRILHIKSGDNPGLVLENTGGGRHFLHTHSDGSFAILNDITGVEPLKITSAGKVGIGTTSPSDILHVKFPAGAENAVVIDTTDSSGDSSEPWLDFNSAGVNKFSLGWDVTSNTFMISNCTSTSKFVLGQNGYLGLGGQDTTYPLSVSSGAHVTVGGVWTDASSRQYKENIVELTYDNALTTLKDLTPVTYNYKVDEEDSYVGFIAEDVPELVARKDRKSLSPMDIVAVLTKVVQRQQDTTEMWQNEMKKLNSKLKNVDQDNVALKTENNLLREELVSLKERQNALEAMFLVGTDVQEKKLAKFCDKTR